jgi:purine nucleosidase
LFRSATEQARNLKDISVPEVSRTTEEALVVDGDWGGDELMLLSLLLAYSKTPVTMLTAVAGNVGCEAVSKNMYAIKSWLGAPLISAFPCFDQNKAFDGAHGANGMGGITLPEPTLPENADPALTGLHNLLERQSHASVTLFASGPLTNIANVLKNDPAFADKIKALLVMGGSLADMPTPHGKRRGNITPFSEFNVFSDPISAKYVLNLLGEKVTLFPMDCTHQLTFSAQRENLLATSQIPPQTKETLKHLLQVPAEMEMKKFGIPPVMHDLHVALYYLFPDLYEIQSGGVSVASSGPETGKTTLSTEAPAVHFCTKLKDPNIAFDKLLGSFEHNLGAPEPLYADTAGFNNAS